MECLGVVDMRLSSLQSREHAPKARSARVCMRISSCGPVRGSGRIPYISDGRPGVGRADGSTAMRSETGGRGREKTQKQSVSGRFDRASWCMEEDVRTRAWVRGWNRNPTSRITAWRCHDLLPAPRDHHRGAGAAAEADDGPLCSLVRVPLALRLLGCVRLHRDRPRSASPCRLRGISCLSRTHGNTKWHTHAHACREQRTRCCFRLS